MREARKSEANCSTPSPHQSGWLKRTLRDLVKIESPSDDKPAVDDACAYVSRLAKPLVVASRFTTKALR